MGKRQPASPDRSRQSRIRQALPWPKCFYDLQHFKMCVSITVSGSCHICLSWELDVEVPLNKNLGNVRVCFFYFPNNCSTDTFMWLRFLLKTPRTLESKLQRGQAVASLLLQQCVFRGLLNVQKKGSDSCLISETIGAVSHADPKRREELGSLVGRCILPSTDVYLSSWHAEQCAG